MSQPDLVSRLRDARPVAPPELRERVRLIAAEAAVPSRHRLTWRRAAVVLVPVAAAIVAAVVLLPHGGKQAAPQPVLADRGAVGGAAGQQHAFSLAPSVGAPKAQLVPAPSPTRAQRYSASLELRLPSARAVSDATKRATQIVASLGGYPASLNVSASGSTGYADLRYRVPRAHVQEAVRRLSALGTIVSENVSVQDIQAQINGTADLIARLQRQLAALGTQPQTTATERQLAALTARVQRLQRGQAATLRAAHYATVELQLTTRTPVPRVVHPHHGPLHGLGIAFHWLWVGAIYALALGAPLAAFVAALWLLVRALRRRRENALLSRS